MSAPALLYVVASGRYSDRKGLLSLYKVNGYPAGILMYGSGGTFFPTRDQARAAITRSEKYAKENKLNWHWGHQIITIRPRKAST